MRLISSTFRDLRPEREAVRDVLNRRARVTPWGMELFASSPEKPPKVCLEWLHMSDAVVLVIGFFAGSLIRESPELTYTCAEFELAQQLGRPVFAFFKTEGGVPLNKETDPEKKKALDDFKSAVSSNGITPAYSDSTVLGDQHSQHANALAAVSADTPLVTVVGGRLIARGVSLAKMLSLANAFEISDFQEDEIGATRTGRSECNNVTCPGGW